MTLAITIIVTVLITVCLVTAGLIYAIGRLMDAIGD